MFYVNVIVVTWPVLYVRRVIKNGLIKNGLIKNELNKNELNKNELIKKGQ